VSLSADRPAIIQAVRDYKDFDPEVDVHHDHSIGMVLISNDVYVFRFTYDDERYDYGVETGKRTLSIMHLSEFRSLKLGKRVKLSAEKMTQEGIN
jgi:hypothetical protein